MFVNMLNLILVIVCDAVNLLYAVVKPLNYFHA